MKLSVKKRQENSRHCFVCGLQNDYGLKARFYQVDDNLLVAFCKLDSLHQSYPGVSHGGVLSALLDEAIGRAIQINEPTTWGMTGELTVRFLHKVDEGAEIMILSQITENNRFTFKGKGVR